MNIVRYAALAIVLAAGQQARAEVMSLTMHAGQPYQTLDAGNYSDVFDGTASLPSRFQIVSARYGFSFFDLSHGGDLPYAPPVTTSTDATPYALASQYMDEHGQLTAQYWRSMLIDQSIARVNKSVSLSFEGKDAGTSAFALASSSGTTGPEEWVDTTMDDSILDFGDFPYECRHDVYCHAPSLLSKFYTDIYIRTTTLTNQYEHVLNIVDDLTDTGLIDHLQKTGQLHFDLGLNSELTMANAFLYIDYIDLSDAADNAVPEPGTMALAFAALGAVGLTRARPRRKTTVTAVHDMSES
jgi:hypothetical protein